jgi:hypothetical protein
MTVPEIIAEGGRLGLKLNVKGGELVVQSSGMRPHPFLKALRFSKAGVIEALQAEAPRKCERSELSEECRGKAAIFTATELPLPPIMPAVGLEEQKRAVEAVERLGKPAIGWCLMRANEYFERFPKSSFQLQDAAAALDLLRSQASDEKLVD